MQKDNKKFKIEFKIRSFRAEKIVVGDLEDYKTKLEVIRTLNKEVYVISQERIHK